MENEGRKRSTSPHRGRRTICLCLLNLGSPPGGAEGAGLIIRNTSRFFEVLPISILLIGRERKFYTLQRSFDCS